MSESVHMSIFLKFNWADNHKINRVYSFEIKNQKFVNEIFDKFYDQNKMNWFNQFTSFDYSVFVIWKTIIKNDKIIRKKRVVVNIRDLNQIIQTNAYFMSSQTNIIAIVTDCIHISIVDVQKYFYQWQIKEKNRHKQTIIIHRDQKQFNVTIMKFKNFPIYVQRQTDFMLKNFRDFVKIYINDIVFFLNRYQHIWNISTPNFKDFRNTT